MRLLALLLGLSLLASGKTMAVTWQATPVAFAGRIVELRLTDGTIIQGSWISVTGESVMFSRIGRSRPASSSGTALVILRSRIRRIDLRQNRVRGRISGTLAGVFGSPSAIAAADPTGNAYVGGLFIAVAGGAAGFWIGSRFDHRVTDHVRIVSP